MPPGSGGLQRQARPGDRQCCVPAGSARANPVNDADEMAALFFELGFEATRLVDAGKRERQLREQREKWQQARESEFETVQRIDASQHLAASEKADAWKRFLGDVSQDNPFSSRDDEMRARAKSRRDHYWKSEHSSGLQNVYEYAATSSSNIPARLTEIARGGHYIAYDDGLVIDTRTNLMWAAKDNGENVNWNVARVYCENYRGGGYSDWRMPIQPFIWCKSPGASVCP